MSFENGRARDLLEIYFKQIKQAAKFQGEQTHFLTSEEEFDLAKAISLAEEAKNTLEQLSSKDSLRPELEKTIEEGKRAQERLVFANTKLVTREAKSQLFQLNDGIFSAEELAEMIQDGNEGLIKATLKFDPLRGNRFSTYASWCIRRTIVRAAIKRAKGGDTSSLDDETQDGVDYIEMTPDKGISVERQAELDCIQDIFIKIFTVLAKTPTNRKLLQAVAHVYGLFGQTVLETSEMATAQGCPTDTIAKHNRIGRKQIKNYLYLGFKDEGMEDFRKIAYSD